MDATVLPLSGTPREGIPAGYSLPSLGVPDRHLLFHRPSSLAHRPAQSDYVSTRPVRRRRNSRTTRQMPSANRANTIIATTGAISAGMATGAAIMSSSTLTMGLARPAVLAVITGRLVALTAWTLPAATSPSTRASAGFILLNA